MGAAVARNGGGTAVGIGRTIGLLIAAAGVLGGTGAMASGGVQGWVYYGVARANAEDRQGHTTDGGKLRPEDRGAMPDWDSIRPGDRFRTTQEVNLRSDATGESETVLERPLPGRTCVQVIRRNAQPSVNLDLESGGWLFVSPVSCRSAPTGNAEAGSAAATPVAASARSAAAAEPPKAPKEANIWTFLKDNHDTLVLIGSGLAALATALWAVFTFMIGRRDRIQGRPAGTGSATTPPGEG